MNSQKNKKAKTTVNKPYATWSNEQRIKLLQTRIRLNYLFTGQNSNSSTGWKHVVAECQFGPVKTHLGCKQQWCGLMKKYKSFFKINTGDGAGDEAPEENKNREDWLYFEIIHQYANQKNNYHPNYLLSNTRGVYRRPIDDRTNSTSPAPSASRGSDSVRNIEAFSPAPSTSRGSDGDTNMESFSPAPSSSSGGNKKQNLSSQERYFKRRDRRLEKKINALLGVFEQLVKIQQLNINVDALLISSESEDSDE